MGVPYPACVRPGCGHRHDHHVDPADPRAAAVGCWLCPCPAYLVLLDAETGQPVNPTELSIEAVRDQVADDLGLRRPPPERVTRLNDRRPVTDIWTDPDPAVRPDPIPRQLAALAATLGRLGLAWLRELPSRKPR